MNYSILETGQTVALNQTNPYLGYESSIVPESLKLQQLDMHNFDECGFHPSLSAEAQMHEYHRQVLKDFSPDKPQFEHEMNTYNPDRGMARLNLLHSGSIRGPELPNHCDFDFQHLDIDPRGPTGEFNLNKFNGEVMQRLRNTAKFFNDDHRQDSNAPHSHSDVIRIRQQVFEKAKKNNTNFHQERENILTTFFYAPLKVVEFIHGMVRGNSITEELKNGTVHKQKRKEQIVTSDFGESFVVNGKRYRLRDIQSLESLITTDMEFAESKVGQLVKTLLYEYKRYQALSDMQEFQELDEQQARTFAITIQRIRDIITDMEFNDKELYNTLSTLKTTIDLQGKYKQKLEIPFGVALEIARVRSAGKLRSHEVKDIYNEILDSTSKGKNIDDVLKKYKIFDIKSRKRIQSLFDQDIKDPHLKPLTPSKTKLVAKKQKPGKITIDMHEEKLTPTRQLKHNVNSNYRNSTKMTSYDFDFDDREIAVFDHWVR